MAIETVAGPLLSIQEILEGWSLKASPRDLERRRNVFARVDELTREMKLPEGYVEEVIRSGREDPEMDGAPMMPGMPEHR